MLQRFLVYFVFGLQFCGGYCSAIETMARHRSSAVSFLHCIGSVPLYIYPILTLLLNQELWGRDRSGRNGKRQHDTAT
jgi:hypothetical protein